jgi:phosphonate transport system substrate-binding protein
MDAMLRASLKTFHLGRDRGGRATGRVVLGLCLFAAIVYIGVEAMETLRARATVEPDQQAAVRSTGLVAGAPAKGLAPRFTDLQGRLLADPPSSPAKLADPQEIVVAHLPNGDPENPSVNWQEFEQHVAQVTGKQVTDRLYENGPDDLADVADGKITVVALHAAETPFLVNNYGFQPVAVLGDSGGSASGNRLQIIVPADSALSKPSDLKGRSLVCTLPSSIVGYRAAVALLMQDQKMRPNVDYFITWSLSQTRSITGVAAKQYEAAAVSFDKVQSLQRKGQVQPSQYKVIYESQVIPRTTIGYFYDLKPELAAKVREAILSFAPMVSKEEGNDPEADPGAASSAPDKSAPLRFVPVDYRRDFQLVRTIDDSFDPRLGPKVKGKAATQPTTRPAGQ